MVRRLVADDSYGRVPFSRTIELREVDPLPRTEHELAVAHGERHGASDDDGFHVSWAVSLGVGVPRVARHRALERREHVRLHIRVSVLVHEHRGGRVRDRDRADPVTDLRSRHRSLYSRRDVDGLLPLRGLDAELLMSHRHFSFIAGGRLAPGAPAPSPATPFHAGFAGEYIARAPLARRLRPSDEDC